MKIVIMYATAGHGHKKAAEYLNDELLRRKKTGADLDVICCDLFEKTPALFSKTYPGTYEFVVKNLSPLWAVGYWLTNVKWIAACVRPFRRIYNKMNSLALERFFITENADVLLFAHFFPPEVATHLKRQGKISSKIVTVITDCFPHFTWINKGTDAYIVMTDDSKKAVASWGVQEDTIHVFGIPVGAQFGYKGNKQEMLKKFSFDNGRFTILLTSGSFGMGPLEALIDALVDFQDRIQVLIVCGNNKELFNRISGKHIPYPVRVFGFVNNMDELMEASDIVISKSGGITMCESLAKKVPLVISKPIPGQEAGNARYLMEHNCAFRITEPDDIKDVVGALLERSDILAKKRENIEKVRKPDATEAIIDYVLR